MRLPGKIRRFMPSKLAARLTVLVTFTATLSVAIAVASMLFMGWKSAEDGAKTNARKDARAIAFSLAAPLAFSDSVGTSEVLQLLSRRPDVLAVWVRDAEGRLVLSYGAVTEPAAVREGGSLREGQIVVTQPVFAGRDADQVGSVTMRIDLSGAQAELSRQVLAAAIASLVALALTVMLSRKMARRLSVPVVRLAEAADELTRDWSHPRRLNVTGPGEIGVALAAYNHMVDELGRRDAAVQKLTDELREAAAAADAARKQAESASIAKTRFLANMSHELRSPLNGVIGAAQLLRKSNRDPAFRDELIRIIQTSGGNLLDLIEGVLDVSRIEAGRVRTDKQPFELVQCVEAAVVPAVASAVVKGVSLECHIEADVPTWCVGDVSRVKQLLQNLLGNAVKFTDSGTVSLTVARDAERGELTFCVADSGVGIPADLLETIFEPFSQGDPSATRRFGGSGLGLAICRDVARLMHGDVRVESTPGKGSRFTLNLPLPAVVHAGGPPVQIRSLVRVFEPVPSRRRSLAALLQRLGCRVQFLDDLKAVYAAISRSRHEGAGEEIWLVAAESSEGPAVLRALHGKKSQPRVAILGNTAQYIGTADQLSRPVTLSALRAFVVADEQAAQTALVSAPLSRRKVRARVLLVEDDAVNRLVVGAMVEGSEFHCVVASNGADALRYLRTEHFDAVLMDWQMPDMDGLEVTRHLRSGICGELNRAVPVIALTANAFAEDRNACLAAGMNDFLTKPVLAQTLLQCVQRWCRSSDTSGEVQQISGVVAMPARDEVPVYEPSVLGALCGSAGGAGGVQELLQMFCSNASSALPLMDAAVESAEWNALQRQVHTLKSSAGQVGAMVLSRAAAALEARLRTGELGSRGDVAQLRDALMRFMAAAGVMASAA